MNHPPFAMPAIALPRLLARMLCSALLTAASVAGMAAGPDAAGRGVALGQTAIGTNQYPQGGLARRDVLSTSGQNYYGCAAIDEAGGYAFFGTNTSPGKIVKIQLGRGSTPPSIVDTLILPSGESNLRSVAFDSSRGILYFGTGSSPGRVVRVAAGNGSAAPVRLDSVTLQLGENQLVSAAIDASAGYVYFGTGTAASPGRVIKVSVTDAETQPTRVAVLPLNLGEDNLRCVALDPAGGVGFFGTGTEPARIIKVALGSGNAAPSRLGAITLAPEENNLQCVIADPATGQLFFGTGADTTPGRIIHVAPGGGTSPPVRVGALTLSSGEESPASVTFDSVTGIACFTTGEWVSPARIVKVSLPRNASPLARKGGIVLLGGENYLEASVFDPQTACLYAATDFSPGRIVRIAVNLPGRLWGNRVKLPRDASSIDEFRLHTLAAGGSVRAAIYNDRSPRQLLWESLAVPNGGGDIVIPVSTGTPSALPLNAGNYWLAWQTDSTADVGSYTTGASIEGFMAWHDFGAAPAILTTTTAPATTARWTQSIVYTTGDGMTGWTAR